MSANIRKRKRPEEMAATSALLKGQGSTKFTDRWPGMRPVVLKLLKQEHVTREEWQDLFWCVFCDVYVMYVLCFVGGVV